MSETCLVEILGLMAYKEAWQLQERLSTEIAEGKRPATLLLLEHPHTYTFGRRGHAENLLWDAAELRRRGVSVHWVDRGGDVTYHGPGQLVGYPLLALEPGRRDIRRYVHDLEEVLIRALADFGIEAHRHDVHRGVWVGTKKIASLGIRVSRWVTCHGFALNVNTDLSFFSLITPCGIAGCRMTSIATETGTPADMNAVIERVTHHFADVFEREITREPHTIEAANG
jgi:lipoate-protein ligase B